MQISPAFGPNTYQIMYGETFDFQCQRQLSLAFWSDREKYLKGVATTHWLDEG